MALATLVALAAGLLVHLGGRETMSYDALWHVFTARQPLGRPFFEMVWSHAHPPLFFFLLKAANTLGNTLLVYRAIPILSTLGSMLVVACLVRRMTASTWLAPIAAGAFGFSFTAAMLALRVQSYALTILIILAALLPYLILVEHGFGGPSALMRERVWFSSLISVGFMVHYMTGFFIAACTLAPIFLASISADYRARLLVGLRRHWLANSLTFGVPALVVVLVYRAHVSLWTGRLDHVPGFMFDPARETLPAFLARTTVSLVGLFSPLGSVATSVPGLLLAASVVVAVTATAIIASRRGTLPWAAAGALTMLPLLWMLTMAAASLGRYPYGGPMRHQSFLLPFLLIALFVAADQVAILSNRRWVQAMVTVVLLGGALANTGSWLREFRIHPGPLSGVEFGVFREHFGEPPVVYVDQFNLVLFFANYHDWTWQFEGVAAGSETVDLWRLTKGGRTFHLCHDRDRWLIDFSQPAAYHVLAACLAATAADHIAVVRIHHFGLPLEWPIDEAPAFAATLAPAAGLEPSSVVVRGQDVYAGFVAR